MHNGPANVTYRAFFPALDLLVFALYGTPVNGEYASIPINFEKELTVIDNDSKQQTTSSRMVVLNVPQASGPRGIDTFTMTEYFTVYTNFGIITFQDVKIGTNTTTTSYTSTYGNFTQDDDAVITLKRQMVYDSKGEVLGMNLDINIPTAF